MHDVRVRAPRFPRVPSPAFLCSEIERQQPVASPRRKRRSPSPRTLREPRAASEPVRQADAAPHDGAASTASGAATPRAGPSGAPRRSTLASADPARPRCAAPRRTGARPRALRSSTAGALNRTAGVLALASDGKRSSPFEAMRRRRRRRRFARRDDGDELTARSAVRVADDALIDSCRHARRRGRASRTIYYNDSMSSPRRGRESRTTSPLLLDYGRAGDRADYADGDAYNEYVLPKPGPTEALSGGRRPTSATTTTQYEEYARQPRARVGLGERRPSESSASTSWHLLDRPLPANTRQAPPPRPPSGGPGRVRRRRRRRASRWRSSRQRN